MRAKRLKQRSPRGLKSRQDSYASVLTRINDAVLDFIRRGILPKLEGDNATGRPWLKADNEEFTVFQERFGWVDVQFAAFIDSPSVFSLLSGEAAKIVSVNDANTILRVDVLRAEAGKQDLIDNWVAYNHNLIKTLGQNTIGKVKNIVYDGASRGVRASAISERIQSELGVSESRAKLIARDQVLKFNASLNKMKFTNLGLFKYKWMDAGDSKTRPDHHALSVSGKIYDFREPPLHAHGEDLNPGEDYQCRCWAKIIDTEDAT